MRLTYDSKTDRAYIWLRDFGEGDDSRQYVATGPDFRGIFVLDFDRQGRLLGIEVIGARDGLPVGVLDNAEPGVHPVET